tara:strand:+ start:532 stop:783 length:252 start_codon:yes stop_codon:yes gene_type:complete
MKKKLPHNLKEVSEEIDSIFEKIKLLNSRLEKLENNNFKINNDKFNKNQKYEIKLSSASIFQLKIISIIAIVLISLYWAFEVF